MNTFVYKNKKIIFLSIISFLLIIILSFYIFNKQYINIAVALPLTGDNQLAGKSILEGLNLKVYLINKKGGINGKKIFLDVYDDKNDQKIAKKIAYEIVKAKKHIAVIGHYSDLCSISAGKIYNKYNIPAISPSSKSLQITKNNKWYFKTNSSYDLDSRYLVTYIKNIFYPSSITIINEIQKYGSNIADIYNKTAKELGIKINNILQFDSNNPDIDIEFRKIVRKISFSKSSDVIFIAAKPDECLKIIKMLKKGLIKSLIVCSSLLDSAFKNSFNNYQNNEKFYYSDDVYVYAPNTKDNSNETGKIFNNEFQDRYYKKSNILSEYAFDTMIFIENAIKNIKPYSKQLDILELRNTFRDNLANINSKKRAVKGITGINYFDENRNSQKIGIIGIYKKQNLISPAIQLTQFDDIYTLSELNNSENNRNSELKNLENNRNSQLNNSENNRNIVNFENNLMYKTFIVYTGIEIVDITDINFKKNTCQIEFYLWFRHISEIKPEDISFINTLNPVKIGRPVKEEISGNQRYIKYHFKEQFIMNYFSNNYLLNQNYIKIIFCHNRLPKNKIVYVADIIGMNCIKTQSFKEHLNNDRVLATYKSWKIDKANFYQEYVEKNTLGSLIYQDVMDATLKHSSFNLSILIKKNSYNIRGNIRYELAIEMSIISFILLIFFSILIRISTNQYPLTILWILTIIMLCLFLISNECIIIKKFGMLIGQHIFNNIEFIFDMWWWLFLTTLLYFFMKKYLLLPYKDANAELKNLIFIYFLKVTIVIISFIFLFLLFFDNTMTNVLFGSSLFITIIGLSVQRDISNYFSGIIMNLDKTIAIGDWIKINSIEGRILNVTKRMTKLLTRNDSFAWIPNHNISISSINDYYPGKIFKRSIELFVKQSTPPDKVKKVLLKALSETSEVILKKPEPEIYFTEILKWANVYKIIYYCNNIEDYFKYDEALWLSVYKQMKKNNIKPAINNSKVKILNNYEDELI